MAHKSYVVKLVQDYTDEDLNSLKRYISEFCHADFVKFSKKYNSLVVSKISDGYEKLIASNNIVSRIDGNLLDGFDDFDIKNIDADKILDKVEDFGDKVENKVEDLSTKEKIALGIVGLIVVIVIAWAVFF